MLNLEQQIEGALRDRAEGNVLKRSSSFGYHFPWSVLIDQFSPERPLPDFSLDKYFLVVFNSPQESFLCRDLLDCLAVFLRVLKSYESN